MNRRGTRIRSRKNKKNKKNVKNKKSESRREDPITEGTAIEEKIQAIAMFHDA